MRMIPYYVLTPEEYFEARRVKHLMGYCLDGEERAEEIRAAGCLFRRNDPFRTEQYDAAYFALTGLRHRLLDDAESPGWIGETAFMAGIRKDQANAVQQVLDMLPHPGTLEPVAPIDEKYVAI